MPTSMGSCTRLPWSWREEDDCFGLEDGDHVEGQMLKTGLVLPGDADWIVEDCGVAADHCDQQVEDEGYSWEDQQHPGRAVGVGAAGEIEMRGDGAFERMRTVEGGVGDP